MQHAPFDLAAAITAAITRQAAADAEARRQRTALQHRRAAPLLAALEAALRVDLGADLYTALGITVAFTVDATEQVQAEAMYQYHGTGWYLRLVEPRQWELAGSEVLVVPIGTDLADEVLLALGRQRSAEPQ